MKSFFLVFFDFFPGAEAGVFGLAVLELGQAVGLALAGALRTVQFHVKAAKKSGSKPAWLTMGRGGGGAPWLRWPEGANFGGSVLVPGRAGGRSGGPTLLILVRWTRESVVRMAAAS